MSISARQAGAVLLVGAIAWLLIEILDAGQVSPEPSKHPPRSASETPRETRERDSGTESAPVRSSATAEVADADGAGSEIAEVDSAEKVALDELPEMLQHSLSNRVLANINRALARDRLPTLKEDEVLISVEGAERVVERYDAIWRAVGDYDLQIEDYLAALLENAGPGTHVLDTTGWDRVTNRRVVAAIGERTGRDIRKLQGSGKAFVRWREESAVHVRYCVLEPGDDSRIDTLRSQQREHLDTVARRGLQGLAAFFTPR